MSNKLVIALDLDGVIHPFTDAFNKLAVEHGADGPVDFDSWGALNKLPAGVKNKVWKDERLFNTMEPYEDAEEAVPRLALDHEVFIVTSVGANPHIHIPAKWMWLKHYFPMIDWKHFVAMHHKQYFNASVFIDDNANNLLSWKKHNVGRLYYPSRPWNKDFDGFLDNIGAVKYTNMMDIVHDIRAEINEQELVNLNAAIHGARGLL